MNLDSDGYRFQQITWVQPPFAFSDGTSLFDFSLPIIAESIVGFFLGMLERLEDEDSDDEDEEEKARKEAEETKKRLRSKVMNLGRAMASLRAERKLNIASLVEGGQDDQESEDDSALSVFERAQKRDREKEMGTIFSEKENKEKN